MTLLLTLGDVALRPPCDEDLIELAERAAQPEAVLPAAQAHFVTWIAGRTPPEITQQRIARVQANRDLTRRPGWTLDLAVMVAGETVGLQSLSGFDQWPQRRVVGTTSWLLAPWQRQGIGTRARAAVLELAFAHLGAQSAKSWALDDNHASIKVSTTLGYRLVDRHHITEHGRQYAEGVYQLDKDDWWAFPTRRHHQPVITGHQEIQKLLLDR